ncbi:MAG TPA: DUF3047 domain-containing protein [Burkholderiaceae bacterium]|nr:DUF3047 domain-containing protein [Burkholderiaceae bacterium]
MRTLIALMLGLCVALPAGAAGEATIAAFSAAAPGEAPAPWKFATLPNKAPTKFTVAELEGAKVLKVESENAYGNIVHPLKVDVTDKAVVAWRWRVDHLVDGADLTQRSGEDSPAKLCVFFGFDGSKLSLGERTKLALARSSTGQDVPTQALCYVWDNKLAVDTGMASVFTKRVRFIVLQSGSAKVGTWVAQKRDLVADYQRMFGDEAQGQVPPVTGVSVGADTDNTHGNSLAYIGDITLTP